MQSLDWTLMLDFSLDFDTLFYEGSYFMFIEASVGQSALTDHMIISTLLINNL